MRAADVSLASLLLWHVGTADRNAAQSRYSLRGWLSALLSQRCIYQMFVRGNCRNSAGPSQRVPPTGQVTVRFAAQHPDICHRGGHPPCQRRSYADRMLSKRRRSDHSSLVSGVAKVSWQQRAQTPRRLWMLAGYGSWRISKTWRSYRCSCRRSFVRFSSVPCGGLRLSRYAPPLASFLAPPPSDSAATAPPKPSRLLPYGREAANDAPTSCHAASCQKFRADWMEERAGWFNCDAHCVALLAAPSKGPLIGGAEPRHGATGESIPPKRRRAVPPGK